MTDSHIFPRAEVTECSEERHPKDKSVLKNVEAKPDFVNCHSSISCQNRRAQSGQPVGPWQISSAIALSQCYVQMSTHTCHNQGCSGERMVPARALWCATHTKHPASETWVLQPSPLGRRDTEGTGHPFSLTVLSQACFLLVPPIFSSSFNVHKQGLTSPA